MSVGPLTPEALGEWVDRTARALDLPLDPAHRPGVIANLQRLAELAASLEEPALGAADESASVFRA